MNPTPSADAYQATTKWSLVLDARDHDPTAARSSLLALCLRYWYPVYAFVRRSGHAPERAHDLTRMFFQRLVQADEARTTGRRYGRFREYLLAQLHRFLADRHDRPSDDTLLAVPELAEMEARLRAQAAAGESPEALLRRSFALEMLGYAHKQLRREALEAGRLQMFEALERYLGVEPQPGELDALALALQVRPLFLVTAVHRLRQRFRELVDRELSETLVGPGELEGERQALMEALSGEPQ